MRSSDHDTDIIREGDHIIIKKIYDQENIKVFRVQPDKPIHYGKLNFQFNGVIGRPYGTIYEIKDKQMHLIQYFSQIDLEISELISSSSTFDDKNQFSQEKYLKKKKKRFSNIVTVLRPNLRLIQQAYYCRDKIGGLRLDSLSQILTYGNIQNHSKCLVVDNNYGLITAAIISRCLPQGLCIQVTLDDGLIMSYRQAVEALNIPPESLVGHLLAIKATDIALLSEGIEPSTKDEPSKFRNCYKKRPGGTRDGDSDLQTIVDNCLVDELDETLIKKESNRAMRLKERDKAVVLLKARCLDALVIAPQQHHPLALLELLLPFLLPSRPFVIYSDTIEPLVECHEYIKARSCAVSVNLTETWLRSYQVLPDRTRPLLRSFDLYAQC